MFQDSIKKAVKVLLLAVLLTSLVFCYFSIRFKRFQWASTPHSSMPEACRLDTAKINEEATHSPFQEGQHYKKIPAKITTHPDIQNFIAENPNQVQVIEFFSYACLWCQRLHPYVDRWANQKPDNVVLYRFPVVFSQGWEVLAKAYYVVEKLGKTGTLDSVLFDAIHKKQMNLGHEKQVEAFLAQQGILPKTFSELYHSFGIQHAFLRGRRIVDAYQVVMSPAIIVNTTSGSYLLSPVMAGSEQGVIEIMNYLINRDRVLPPGK